MRKVAGSDTKTEANLSLEHCPSNFGPRDCLHGTQQAPATHLGFASDWLVLLLLTVDRIVLMAEFHCCSCLPPASCPAGLPGAW